MAQYSAIKMLHSRIRIVLAYIKDVESGVLEPNHEILREAYSLSHRLPVVQGSTFREEYYTVKQFFLKFNCDWSYFGIHFSNRTTLV